jgi:soluble lytic murein transglycosylase
MAMELEKYKEVIYFAEPRDESEFLPYSYPLAYDEIIEDAAQSEGLDKYLIAALIREESRYDPEVVSWAGAVGLMQLMPTTANQVNNQIKAHIRDSSNLHDVKTNILFGAHYLAGLIKEYEKIPFAIIAYNAGGNNLKKWLTRYYKDDITEFVEHIPYKETKGYIKKVLKSYWQYRYINGLPVKTVYN